MDINISEQEDRLVVTFKGNMDNASISEAEQALALSFSVKTVTF